MEPRSPRLARSIAFIASFCLLAVEIVSGRASAPYLGTSLFSWTSVIGIVLLGLTLGSYVGGIWADRWFSRFTLGATLAGSGAAAILATYVVPMLGAAITGWALPLWQRALLFALLGFFPFAFLISAVTPLLLRWEIADHEHAGRTYGSLGMWSALGSLLGTFSAGFFLIGEFGTHKLLLMTGALLIALGLFVARDWALIRNKVAPLVAVFAVGSFLLPTYCRVETDYYCIRVTEEFGETGPTYILRLDHLIHSYVDPLHPDALGYGYELVYSNLIAYRNEEKQDFRVLFIGGGGYTLPRYLEAYYPSVESTVTEIDPGVTEANHDLMDLSRQTTIRTINRDARMYLAQDERERTFDLVFGDAFNDFSVPYHLTTEEFHRLLKSRMASDGVYAVNIIDDVRYGQFLASMLRTLRAVWSHVYIAPQATELAPGRNTIVLIATDVAIDPARWAAARPARATATEVPEQEEKRREAIHLLSEEQVQAFLADHREPALKDDFVPTDQYLSPVFQDAY
jgi:spermidine synthase